MKQRLALFIIGLLAAAGLLLSPVLAHAVNVLPPICDGGAEVEKPQVCKDDLTTSDSNPLFGPKGVLTTVISVISIVVGIAAVIVIVIAGIKFITSQGDPQKISGARNQIIYALVGVVVAAISQGLVAFVLRKL